MTARQSPVLPSRPPVLGASVLNPGYYPCSYLPLMYVTTTVTNPGDVPVPLLSPTSVRHHSRVDEALVTLSVVPDALPCFNTHTTARLIY